MRSNPLFNNICAVRIGMHRSDPCKGCKKVSECDQHWDQVLQDWDYPLLPLRGNSPVKLVITPGGIYDREILGNS